jgi:hypothetical protein
MTVLREPASEPGRFFTGEDGRPRGLMAKAPGVGCRPPGVSCPTTQFRQGSALGRARLCI